MAEFELPRTWGRKLSIAITAINDEVESLAEGGVQVVRKRLGPYRVTFESPDLAEVGGEALSPPLAEGTIIEQVWLEAVEEWVSATGTPDDAFLQIDATPTADPSDRNGLVYMAVGTGSVQSGGTFPAAAFPVAPDPDAQVPCRLKQEATINVEGETESTWTAGASDLYVLISEPA